MGYLIRIPPHNSFILKPFEYHLFHFISDRASFLRFIQFHLFRLFFLRLTRSQRGISSKSTKQFSFFSGLRTNNWRILKGHTIKMNQPIITINLDFVHSLKKIDIEKISRNEEFNWLFECKSWGILYFLLILLKIFLSD